MRHPPEVPVLKADSQATNCSCKNTVINLLGSTLQVSVNRQKGVKLKTEKTEVQSLCKLACSIHPPNNKKQYACLITTLYI